MAAMGASAKRSAAKQAKQPATPPTSRAATSIEADQLVTAPMVSQLMSADRDAGIALSGQDELVELRARSGYSVDFFSDAAVRDYADAVAQALEHVAHGLLESFETLLADQELWERLAKRDVPQLTWDTNVRLAELIRQDLPVLLDRLGYVQPPPSSAWAVRLQQPMVRLLDHPDVRTDHLVGQAQHELRVLTWRIRTVLERRRQPESEDSGWTRTRHQLAVVVRAGREKALPAAVAAAGGVAFQAFGAPELATGAVFGAAGLKLATMMLEIGSVALLAEPERDVTQGAAEKFAQAAHILQDGLSRYDDGDRGPAAVFLLRRAASELLCQGGELSPRDREFLWSWGVKLDGALSLQKSVEELAQELDNRLGRIARAG